jgi:hypothetical protein
MSDPRPLRTYEYVDRPFDRVRAALRSHAAELLQRSTHSASARADSIVANIQVGAGGLAVGVDVRIQIGAIRDEDAVGGMLPVTHVPLTWAAAQSPALFPSMEAELSAWPLSKDETQLEIKGTYEPPLGPVGTAIDATLLHGVAEASVKRLLDDLAEQLRRELT